MKKICLPGDMEKFLPHRDIALPGFTGIVCDTITQTATAELMIEENDHFFTGHFPGRPIMPGHWQVECLFLVAATLVHALFEEEMGGQIPVATGIEASFKGMVKPGDTLTLEVKLEKNRDAKLFFFSGKITNQRGDVICIASKFSGAAMDISRL